METPFLDMALVFLYQSCALWCAHKKTMAKASLYCFLGATVCFLVAWGIFYLNTPPPHWFHLSIAATFFTWAYFMAKYCEAKTTAIAIGAFGLFQAIYSYEWFLSGTTPTGLGTYYVTIAVAFHLLIMATYTNGLVIHSRTSRGTARRSTAV